MADHYDGIKYPMIWNRVSNKGYCFTARIPCRVIRRAGKKIRIAALLADGREREHLVLPEKLKHSPCHCANGNRCQAVVIDGESSLGQAYFYKEGAEARRILLDHPEENSWVKDLEKNHPKEMARYKATVKPAVCGPHKVIEYRPVES